MILKRLRLANYRGVEACDVEFSPVGMTVVEGPNEAGKTSLAQALRIIIEYPDNSKHRDVVAMKPVHRDETTEIEVEIEAGETEFVYLKHFHKKPKTELRVTAPKAETLTGREAHERAGKILAGVMDMDLWRALNVEQGQSLSAPDFTKQYSLTAALESAAGGAARDAQAENLFEAVKREYVKYYTPEKGDEGRDLKNARSACAAAEEKASALNLKIGGLEKDVAVAAQSKARLALLAGQRESLEKEVEEAKAAIDKIAVIESEQAAFRRNHENLSEKRVRAARAVSTRNVQKDLVERLSKELVELEASLEKTAPSFLGAKRLVDEAAPAAREAERAEAEADAAAKIRRADHEYYRRKLDLETMRERKGRIDDARRIAAETQTVRGAGKVDARQLDALDQAERELALAKARFEAGIPAVDLKALSNVDLLVDGTAAPMKTGDERKLPVRGELKVVVPDVLEFWVRSGTETDERGKALEKARATYEKKCRAAGVADVEEARQAFKAGEKAEEAKRLLAKAEEENLRDLTYDDLERRVIGLEKHLPEHAASRPGSPPMAADMNQARKLREEAEKSLEQMRDALNFARKKMESAGKLLDEQREGRFQAELLLNGKKKEFDIAVNALGDARSERSDQDLESDLETCERTLSELTIEGARLAEALKREEPERVRDLADNARKSLERIKKETADTQTRLIQIEAGLKVLGEQGLKEELDALLSRLEILRRERDAIVRRAEAAKLLYESMREARDEAKRSYVRPFCEKIDRLGKRLFGETFRANLDDDLRIESRTLEGATIPFDCLSAGAREQLSLIARLACGMMVSVGGGVPIILDDALGFTDPGRLRMMGAVLALAARDCQIILLTCVPDRFKHVGDAKIVSILGPLK